MVDENDTAAEPNRQPRRERPNGGSISFDHPPVDACVGIAANVSRGDEIKFRPADIGADRIQEGVEAAIGIEESRRGNISLIGADRLDPLMQPLQGQSEGGLILSAESEIEALRAPSGSGLVDGESGLGSDPGPRVTICRMQPSTPKVEGIRPLGKRVRPAADPLSSLEDDEGNPAAARLAAAPSPAAPAPMTTISGSSEPRKIMKGLLEPIDCADSERP